MSNTPGDKGARAAREDDKARSETMRVLELNESEEELLRAALRTNRAQLEWLAGKCRQIGNEDGALALLRDAIATSDLIEKIGS